MTFNIWDIRSKTLRVAVAWLIASLAAIVVLVALPFAMVWLAFAGVYHGVRRLVLDYEWRETARWFWAAATGKEAV